MHKTAMGNRAVVAATEESVTFRYTDSGTHQRKLMTLSRDELMRRFLQHVPPKGFHRVRSFGLLSSAQRPLLRQLQLLLSARSEGPPVTSDKESCDPPRLRCPQCGKQTLALVRRLTALECAAFEAASESVPGLAKARAPPPSCRSQVEGTAA